MSLFIFLHLKGVNDFFSGPNILRFWPPGFLNNYLTLALLSPLASIYSSASTDFHSPNCLHQARWRLHTAKYSPSVENTCSSGCLAAISCVSFEELLHPTLELKQAFKRGLISGVWRPANSKTPRTRRKAGWGWLSPVNEYFLTFPRLHGYILLVPWAYPAHSHNSLLTLAQVKFCCS